MKVAGGEPSGHAVVGLEPGEPGEDVAVVGGRAPRLAEAWMNAASDAPTRQ